MWDKLEFKARAQVLRYVLDGVYRHNVTARYTEEYAWVKHLLNGVERVVE
jgi:hypothetical protein